MSSDNNILYGGLDTSSIDNDAKSLGEVALKKFREHGDEILLVNSANGKQLTSKELVTQSVRLAECLRWIGVQKGEVIGLCSENRLEFPVVLYATLYIGAIIAPLNYAYTDRELNQAINLSKPKIIFTSGRATQTVSKVSSQNTFVQNVIVFDKDQATKNTIKYEELMNDQKIPSSGDNFKCTPTNIDTDTAVIVCSSGTTGLPKGVEITEQNILTFVSRTFLFFKAIKQGLTNFTTLSVVPWYHSYGMFSSMAINICGAKLVTMPKYNDKLFLGTIQVHKVNWLLAVPSIMTFLAKSPLIDKYDLSSIILIGCGAAPLSKEIIDAVYKRIGGIVIRQAYGMSESTISVLSQDETHCTPGSVGVLRQNTWGKIINPDTGKTLGPNERGEMCFKGSSIMKGYIGNIKATKHAIDNEGWLHTGDIGYYNDEGEWFVVDRLKELIKFKGFQVPPAEIEAILLTHPCVMAAAVIGLPDDVAGELPLAFVVRRDKSNVTEKEIIDFVAENVSYVKRLHGGVRFINEIPVNSTGKILRRELKELIKNVNSKL